MKIAVIVPAYNARCSIEECLLSLVSQDRLADEIIIVDNNSTDDTYEFVESLIREKRWSIRLLKEYKKGASAARNKGLASLDNSIDIVAFTDSDCVVRNDWLKAIEAFFTKHNEAAGLGGVALGYKPQSVIQKFMAVQHNYLESKALSGMVNRKEGILFGTLIDSRNAAFKKSALTKIGGFDEKVHVAEDADISIRLIEKGHPIWTAQDDIVIFHRDIYYFTEYIRRYFKYRTGEVGTIKRHFKNCIIIKVPFCAPRVFKGKPITALVDIKTLAALIMLIISLKFYLVLVAFFVVYLTVMTFKLARIMAKPEINISVKYSFVFSLLFAVTRMMGPVGRIRGAVKYGIIAM